MPGLTFVRTSMISAVLLAILASSAAAEFTPIAGWDSQLFPSYIIASATMRLPEDATDEGTEVLGDRTGVLGVKLQPSEDDETITVTISSASILEPSSITVTLEDSETEYAIYPHIKYNYRALARTKQSVPVTVTFTVQSGEEDVEEQTVTMTLRSVNDCPFTVMHDEENFTDVGYVFAAYVNEQHPFVDKVLREALNTRIVDSFTGYQSGDPAEVYRQVYALWEALSERDVRYSNITTSAANSNTVYSQHVRLIDESINNSQANCVDGSVLFASLLRKVDIEPVLVFVPGHCYLGFYLDAEGKQLVGLETTLIGSVGDDSARDIDGVANIVDDNWRKKNSWATFCAAIAMGNKNLKENEVKFQDESEADFQLVPIADARARGILPIAFESNDKFEAATPHGN